MRRRALKAVALLSGLAAALGGILLLRPKCLILETTGFYCAGCGTQRMLLALFRGDFAQAARMNLFMLILLPTAGVYLLWEALRYIRGKELLSSRKGFLPVLAGTLVLAAVYTVLRNLPSFAYLAPL